MSEPGVLDLPLPDATARARIARDLDTNLLVEAGAGSGKTTALVRRMVTLIATGTATVDQIAAVTFTRKAAGELRERFQIGVERALRTQRGANEPDELARLDLALREIDRAFIGTIHSFCGRLLRERPLEIGLDPGFEELPVEERIVLRRRFWSSYLERLARDSDPVLENLTRAGLRPASLYGLFDHLVENPDVSFPADHAEPPSMSEVGEVRAELEAIVETGWELMDDHPPSKGWDSLQRKIRRLHFELDISGWSEPADLFEAVAVLCKAGTRGHTTTLNRWREPDMAKALRDRVNAFGFGDTPAQRLVDRWLAHRYALAIELAREAAAAFTAHRHRVGKLDFQDLLLLASRLLRENPDVRRQLGERYRRLLVDEFQDTDPLQAEIMLLLASEPAREPDDGETPPDGRGGLSEWRSAEPRPGALFVVGDPKQSIYRFRRADIQLYAFVKERFADFGEVVTLSTNFRSRPPIGDLVNELFVREGFFPAGATAEQAPFERLDTRPPTEPVVREGVFAYDIAPDQRTKGAAAADDARRLATWIGARVEAGERAASDFMILTRDRGQLASYARALEECGLPVQVTGAGVGVEEEIRELCVLLECMIDPTNPVRVVSALVGLFFGLDYDRLVTHRLEGGGFDAMRPGDRGAPDVVGAIGRLNAWWRASNAEPADVFVGRLVSELGLLPYAAAGDLGTLRAGALLYGLDAVRGATLSGSASLPGALEALLAALDLREAEAPLEPLRQDAVRLMNLHQAKGLEATVVVLANPTESQQRRPDVHLSRSDEGIAQGFLRVGEATASGFRQARDLARPVGWSVYEASERNFEEAEQVRLLYVAVTRAREELVVARWPGGRGSSCWSALDPWLDESAEVLDLDVRPPQAREELTLAPDRIAERIAEARAGVEASGRPTFRHFTVTELTKTPAPEERRSGVARPAAERRDMRGLSWGSAVHGALAVAASAPEVDELRAACRDLLVTHQRPLDDHGEPIELEELVSLVETVRSSDLWRRAAAAEQSMSEVSFAVPGLRREQADGPPVSTPEPSESSRGSRRQLDLFSDAGGSAASAAEADEHLHLPPQEKQAGERAVDVEDRGTGPIPTLGRGDVTDEAVVVEGIVDLAFRESDGWVIADFKTDVGTDPDFPARAEAYRRQVELYAEAWSRLTGDAVKERVLFYTAQDRVEVW